MKKKKFIRKPNPWNPMNKPIDIKHLGKLIEELNEASTAAARCLIQGINGREPSTNRSNKDWLQDEVADVLANINLVIGHFNLNKTKIIVRRIRKTKYLKKWHKMLD